MTKKETIDMIIDDYKNGSQSAMEDYCNGTRCDDCPFDFDDCMNDVAITLIERLVKTEEHQETNLEHYVAYYNNYDQCIYMDAVKLYNEEHRRLNNFEEAIEWLLEPYKPPKPKYKLSQFEYDLLGCYDVGRRISEFWLLDKMHKKGYFKGVPDDIPINKILANCEVIES